MSSLHQYFKFYSVIVNVFKYNQQEFYHIIEPLDAITHMYNTIAPLVYP